MKKITVTFSIPEDLIKEFKLACKTTGKPMSLILSEFMAKFIKQNGVEK